MDDLRRPIIEMMGTQAAQIQRQYEDAIAQAKRSAKQIMHLRNAAKDIAEDQEVLIEEFDCHIGNDSEIREIVTLGMYQRVRCLDYADEQILDGMSENDHIESLSDEEYEQLMRIRNGVARVIAANGNGKKRKALGRGIRDIQRSKKK